MSAVSLGVPAQAAPTPDDAQPAPVAAMSPAVRERLRALAIRRPAEVTETASPDGRRSVFVRFSGPGVAGALREAGGRSPKALATDRREVVARTADRLFRSARREDVGAQRLFEVANAVPGMGLRVDPSALAVLARQPGVVAVTPLSRYTARNASAGQLTRVLATWRRVRETGRGVTIGIVDTGLDYTHADFGGPGTPAAYQAAAADETDGDWRSALPALARRKVVGGFDLAGNGYDAGSPETATPQPDPDPIDCEGHGTHVAGTAAGYGVDSAGRPYTGGYGSLTATALNRMRVGPGMAPRAQIYSLKVFGCAGTTEMVIPALDRALDPNGDGDLTDRLDIVNLSLGSAFAPVDDPINDVLDEISRHGVLPVLSIGNEGDLTDVGGSPASAVSSLAVASSVDAVQVRDGLRVNEPPGLRGTAGGQVSIAYDWAARPPVRADVVTLSEPNADGCEPLSPTDAAAVAGQAAWLEWDDNDATRRCGSAARAGNVKAAGAVGAVFTSDVDIFTAGIAGDEDIPVFQLGRGDSDRLRAPAAGGTLNVTFDGSLIEAVRDADPARTDTLSPFSSRGPHGALGVVKPDVAAPGDSITSAEHGSGDDGVSFSGTSMAAPHAAGVAALVRSRHPAWSVRAVKAAVMNTAVHDLFSGPGRTGGRYGPARVGAGRVDAERAVLTKVLAYVKGENNPVTASFGPVPVSIAGGPVTRVRTVTVQNTGPRAVRVDLRYRAATVQPGVSYSVSRESLRIPARASRTVRVTMRITPEQLRRTIDPTMDVEQLGVPRQFVPDASGWLVVDPRGATALRVPVYGAAEPASTTTASNRAADGGGSLVLAGEGISQGGGGPRAYQSLVSVVELGARSGSLPVCVGEQVGGCVYNDTSRSGDLKFVGAGSNADWLWFGVATRGPWAALASAMTPFVDYDTDGDRVPDFETFATNAPGAAPGSGSDVIVAVTVDLHAEPDAADAIVDVQPVNFNFGDVDTNVFDTDVLTLPVSKRLLNLGRDSAPITYTVGTQDWATGAILDEVDPVSYDAAAPALSLAGPLYRDEGGTEIDYTLNGGAEPVQALVLHLHGLPGARSEVVELSSAPVAADVIRRGE